MQSALLLVKLLSFGSGLFLLRSLRGTHAWSTSLPLVGDNHCHHDPHHATNHNIGSSSQIHYRTTRRSFPNYLQLSSMIRDSTNNADSIIQIVQEPDSDFLSSKGVLDWPTWGCPVSKFPWSYSDTEVCYLIKGKVMVTPVATKNSPVAPTPVTIVAGDYVTLPAGLSCTWDVLEPVEKHYMFI